MVLPWKKKSSKYVCRYPVFDLRSDLMESPRTGNDLQTFVLETRDWVIVIPITSRGEFVMVRQYRFGTEEVTLEIPGGLIDSSDLSPIDAARRELKEETGYHTDQMRCIGSCHPNPAILNNTCHMFCAENVEHKYQQDLDEGEDIQVVLVPSDEIPSMIQDGTIRHSLVMNAFYLLDLDLK